MAVSTMSGLVAAEMETHKPEVATGCMTVANAGLKRERACTCDISENDRQPMW